MSEPVLSTRAPGGVAVFHLPTGTWQTFVGLTALQAVCAAYGQAQGDGNSWGYAARYTRLTRLSVHARTVTCGAFSALTEGHAPPMPRPKTRRQKEKRHA